MSDYGGGADVKATLTVGDCFPNQTQMAQMLSDWQERPCKDLTNFNFDSDAPPPNVPCGFDPHAIFNGTKGIALNAQVVLLLLETEKLSAELSEDADMVNVQYKIVWKRGEDKCAAGLPASSGVYFMYTDVDFVAGTIISTSRCPVFQGSVGDSLAATSITACSLQNMSGVFAFCATYDGTNLERTLKCSY